MCPHCKAKLLESPDGLWCPNCGDVDPADIDLANFEATHYIWFDDNDKPYLSEGWTGFTDGIQLCDAHSY